MDPAPHDNRRTDDEGGTAALPVDEPGTGTGRPAGSPGTTAPAGSGAPAGSAAPAHAPEPGTQPQASPQSEPARPGGTSWATVVLGLVAVAAGVLVLIVQLVDVRIDWSVATPAIVVAAGGVLVLLGLASLANGRDRGDRSD